MYFWWLNFKCDMWSIQWHVRYFLVKLIKCIAIAIFNFICEVIYFLRVCITIILTIVCKIGVLGFVYSLYLGIQTILLLKNGTPFSDIENIDTILKFFFIPIGLHVLKELIDPN